MTITTNPDRDEYTASGGQTVFNYTFRVYNSSDLNVYQTASGQTPDDTTDLITGYTVQNVGNTAGGTITLNTGATNGDLITIVSDIPSSRTTDYQVSGDFLPATVNEDIDRTVSLQKQAEGIARRSLLFPQSFQNTTSLTLPEPAPLQFVRWKNDVSGFENFDLFGSGTFQFVGTHREVHVATASQTVFTLQSGTYEVGINALSVYIDGAEQTGRFTETSTTQITFTEAMAGGERVVIIVNERALSSDAVSAYNTQYGTRNVGDYLDNQTVVSYAAARTLLSSGAFAIGDHFLVEGYPDPWQVKSGTAPTDNGWYLVGGANWAESTSNRVLVSILGTDTTAIDQADVVATALGRPIDFGSGSYTYTGTLTTANAIVGQGAIVDHNPTSDDTDCFVLTGDNKEYYGITVRNLNDQSGDFTTRDAFKVTGDNSKIHHCYVASKFNVSRVDTSVGPNGAGGEPLMMVYNGFNISEATNSHGHDLDVTEGVYTCYRFYGATDCTFYGVDGENAYRYAMYSGDEASIISTGCHLTMGNATNIKEIGTKSEDLCDNNKMTHVQWKDCCTIGAGTGGAEGRLGIFQGQNFTFDYNRINCSTVYNSLDSEGLLAAGGGSSGDRFGNGFKARHNEILNAKSTSGNVFPVFGVNAVTDYEVDHNDIRNAYRAVSVSFGDNGSVSKNKAVDMTNHAFLLARFVNSHCDNNTVIRSTNDGIRCDNSQLGLSRNSTFDDNIIMESSRGLYLVRTKNCTASNNVIQGSATEGTVLSSNDSLTAIGNGWDSQSLSGNTNTTTANNTILTPTLVDAVGTATGSTTADGTADTDAPTGTLYWVVDQSSTAPSATQIKAGQDQGGAAADASGSQAVSASGEQAISVTGLTTATGYYLYCVQDDTHSNESNVESSSLFTTS